MSNKNSLRQDFLDSIRSRLVGPGDLEGRFELAMVEDPDSGTCVAIPANCTDSEFAIRHSDGDLQECFIGGGRSGDSPSERYGIGTLHPAASAQNETSEEDNTLDDSEEGFTSSAELMGINGADLDGTAPPSDGDLADEVARNQRNVTGQQSIGIAFVAPSGAKRVRCLISGGTYSSVGIVGDPKSSARKVWVRKNFQFAAELELTESRTSEISGKENVALNIEIGLIRKSAASGIQHVIAYATNRTTGGTYDERILFQSALKVELLDESGAFLPFSSYDQKIESSIDLLFEHRKVFARGRGVSACWDEQAETVKAVWTDSLPATAVPTVSSDITPALLNATTSKMWEMSHYASKNTHHIWIPDLRRFGELYLQWIEGIETDATGYKDSRARLAMEHVQKCRQAHARFIQGIQLLEDNELVRHAFRLTNQSMAQSRRMGGKTASFEPQWRPFQLFFLVMNLVGMFDPLSADRRTVEMVWLPTGGGKTEAYFATASFTIWLRRLRGIDHGTSVFMRYTLRLLTAQQFQRASRLTVAMEAIRRDEIPQSKPIQIGIWLGSDQLPNSHAKAVEMLNTMESGSNDGSFGVSACPACGTAIGPEAAEPLTAVRGRKRFSANNTRSIPGIRKGGPGGNGVVLFCPNQSCAFHLGLPLLVVDEAIYDCPPDILLATVDKIATLAWTPRARAVFGLDEDGNRKSPGFELIIQDELHLIAGAIGTAVSAYEPLVELLNSHGLAGSDSSSGVAKIICATATISNFELQVEQLYSRKVSALFPPPGLKHGETFFSTAIDGSGKANQGTLYCGLYGPALRSIQTVQARVLAAAIEAGERLADSGPEIDPWWTNVAFFNSLRELGYAVTLVDTDVPDYLRAWSENRSIANRRVRPLPLRRIELTSRIAGDQVPEMLRMLEIAHPQAEAYDVCLASTMIEVGLDVDRLGLMTVMGQPKSTSTYIQVTGRVGRNWTTSPGLILMVYGLRKPRDLSHYEHFQEYHQRLYADVTPTLLAPFIEPALKRFLPATLVGYLRQTLPIAQAAADSAIDVAAEDFKSWEEAYLSRASAANRKGLAERQIEKIRKEITGWTGRKWAVKKGQTIDRAAPPLFGSSADPDVAAMGTYIWRVPTSLRTVEPMVRIAQAHHLGNE